MCTVLEVASKEVDGVDGQRARPANKAECPIPAFPCGPGLYWASVGLAEGYDAIVEVFGKPPFLKSRTIRLNTVSHVGQRIDPRLASSPRVGPRLVLPGSQRRMMSRLQSSPAHPMYWKTRLETVNKPAPLTERTSPTAGAGIGESLWIGSAIPSSFNVKNCIEYLGSLSVGMAWVLCFERGCQRTPASMQCAHAETQVAGHSQSALLASQPTLANGTNGMNGTYFHYKRHEDGAQLLIVKQGSNGSVHSKTAWGWTVSGYRAGKMRGFAKLASQGGLLDTMSMTGRFAASCVARPLTRCQWDTRTPSRGTHGRPAVGC